MAELLRSDMDMDAVFCGNDILAIGAIDACRSARVKVPQQIGVVGFDDVPMAAWTAYNLTTIRQPVAEIIGAAVELAISIVEKDRPAASRLFTCHPVLRDSL
jgi:DNA-binding LacI/PurR family transcriptional regulator